MLGKAKRGNQIKYEGELFFRDSYENENRNKIIILLKTE